MMTKARIIYSTEVIEVGSEASDFQEINMLIMFGDEAPEALRPSCFIIHVNEILADIKVGMKLIIDNQEYQITAVGDEVQTNLGRLGHTAVSFTGASRAKLPGTLYVSDEGYPKVAVGSTIKIVSD